jgi:hypothetical protein
MTETFTQYATQTSTSTSTEIDGETSTQASITTTTSQPEPTTPPNFVAAKVSLCAEADFQDCFMIDFVTYPHVCYPIIGNGLTSINVATNTTCVLSTGKACETENNTQDVQTLSITESKANLTEYITSSLETWNDQSNSFSCLLED